MNMWITAQGKDFVNSGGILYPCMTKSREGSVNFTDFSIYNCYPVYIYHCNYEYYLTKDKKFWANVISHLYRQMKNKNFSLSNMNGMSLLILNVGNMKLPHATAYNVDYGVRLLPYIDRSWIVFEDEIDITKEFIKLIKSNITITNELFRSEANVPYRYDNNYDEMSTFAKSYFKHIRENTNGVRVNYLSPDNNHIKVIVPKEVMIHINDNACVFLDNDELVGCIYNNGVYNSVISVNRSEGEELYDYLYEKYKIDFSTMINKNNDKNKSVDKLKSSIIDNVEGKRLGNKNQFNEDAFLLDYVDYMQKKISMYEFAHKNNMTIMQAFNKLDEYKLTGGP